jgi:hypothetical protein
MIACHRTRRHDDVARSIDTGIMCGESAVPETSHSSVSLSAAQSGRNGAKIGHSVAPDDRRFMAGSGPILKRQGRSPSMLSVV